MADLYDIDFGEEVFVDDEDDISNSEDDIIEGEEEEAVEAPEEDTGTGQGSSSYVEDIEFADEDEDDDDEDDEVSDDEEDVIEEEETEAEEEDDEALFENNDLLETLGAISADDNVLIMLIDGEPTVIGTVGEGDNQRIRIEEIELGLAEVDELVAEKANITDLTAATARIGTLETTALTADSALITGLQAETAKVHNLSANQLEAASAYVEDLVADNIQADDIAANFATLATINSRYISSDQVAANYARIDGANINDATIRTAWINNLMVQSGLLSHDGSIFALDAVEVNANKITAGTLDVSRLIVSQNGHKYLVGYDNQGTATYQKLDGDVIQDSTISADKILAGAITADKITTQNIAGTGGWINLRNGTFNYTNAETGNYIRWDGSYLNLNADNLHINNSDIYTLIDEAAPSANIIPTVNGATISITDSSGTTTANILNGATGADGRSITNITTYYMASHKSSGVVLPTGGEN